ncbi:arginine deiminase family protein [Stygiolobus caldivivus]|uniref:Amidinotransferase n=1 Tax=Stygiolobus caldivivus TaxID=2824673 RepID=A0A8D5U653_9CREN|nr:arginine deiminase family protein [Stygiolobus caldivivus]BCU69561.1 amidinotransferase [Stygiolobus caldivivus]
MKAIARAEWEPLRRVALHKPGLEVFFGLLSPQHSLYKKRFDFMRARREYEELIDTLQGEGVKIYRVLKSIIRKATQDEMFYEKLKKIVGVKADPWFLAKFLVLRPEFVAKDGNIEVRLVNPLSNLYFMRDQQITTKRGVIIGKMAKPQRRGEIELVKLFWESVSVGYEEVTEGTLEGGDFYPMGDFYLIGVGNRSDIKGAMKLISTGEEVGVVREPASEEFFHLDTYFNVISRELVIGVERLMRMSIVSVYKGGKLVKDGIDLISYLKEKEFNFHFVSEEEARNFATNFLTVKSNKVISPFDLKIKGVDTVLVDIKNLSGGFGGIHCMTAVIERG